jgi:hypothetical protein
MPFYTDEELNEIVDDELQTGTISEEEFDTILDQISPIPNRSTSTNVIDIFTKQPYDMYD